MLADADAKAKLSAALPGMMGLVLPPPSPRRQRASNDLKGDASGRRGTKLAQLLTKLNQPRSDRPNKRHIIFFAFPHFMMDVTQTQGDNTMEVSQEFLLGASTAAHQVRGATTATATCGHRSRWNIPALPSRAMMP